MEMPSTSKGSKPTLLFVDDEERILRSLRLLFAQDYKVLIASGGREALAILARERIHVLVSDQRMPEMSGVELLRRVREISPDTMRLLLTGYADREAVIDSINEGEVFRYIGKPWGQDEIRQTVRSAADIAVSLEGLKAPSAPAADQGEVILIVDDDPDIASAIKELVDEHLHGNYRVEWASSLDDAFPVLERGRVALVISEVGLDDEDVTPFIGHLKRHNPHVVTVVLTSFQDASLLVKLINQGQIFRFLPKPLRKNLLLRAIEAGLERHAALKQAPQLARRHAVEAGGGYESPLVQRIAEFFRRLAWA